MSSGQLGQEHHQWWIGLAQQLGVADRTQAFFHEAGGTHGVLIRTEQTGADINYILFIMIRHWIPPVLPPPGRERLTKNDQDYWLESEEILKKAVVRLRELKPLIDLLTAPNPFAPEPPRSSPVVEVELARMLEGIAEVAGSYGGPDYTSIIKSFHPVPLRQIQPFKHNKKHSAELWVIFLLREHFKALGLGKDRYWPLIAEIASAADIRQANGQTYHPDELKSWWTKNWPRTYTLLRDKGPGSEATEHAYQDDYKWFQSWFAWQMSRTVVKES